MIARRRRQPPHPGLSARLGVVLLPPALSRLALITLALLALAACAARGPAGLPHPRVNDAVLDPDVFRVTVLWPGGEPPPEGEALLLERCAELTVRAGASTFFIVHASAPIAHAEWLQAGALLAPTLVIPEEGSAEGGSLSAVIRIFRPHQAPAGYPLYDAQRILRERRRGVTAAGASSESPRRR